MKIRNLVLLLVMIMTLTIGGGISLAQSPPPPGPASNLPTNLRKGIIIGSVFQDPYAFAMNKNPYDYQRATNLYVAQDFDWMQDAAGGPESGVGFDHIRIEFDPYCLGFTYNAGLNTWTYNPNLLVSNLSDASTAQQMITALNYYINNAISRNMAVVLSLHPSFVNEAHYLASAHKWGGAAYSPPTYGGTWKQYFSTTSYGGAAGPNHALSKFWDKFLDQVTTVATETDKIYAPVNSVYFYMLDEPLMEFSWAYWKNPADPDQSEINWKGWFANTVINEWKPVQREALKVCRAKKPGHKFIVTPALGMGEELDSQHPSWHNWVQIQGVFTPDFGSSWWQVDMPTFGNAYSPTELGSAFSATHVIYAAHQFHPFRYTHHDNAIWANPEIGDRYIKERDFEGQMSYLTTTPYRPQWAPARSVMTGRTVAEDSSLDVQGVLQWQMNTPPITGGPRPVYYMPAFYWASMGVGRRGYGGFTYDPNVEQPQADPPPYYYRLERAQWHWDVCRHAEANAMGWAVYEWCGGFGVAETDRLQSALSPTRPIHARSPERSESYPGGIKGDMSSEMRQALFGGSRP